MDISRKVGCRQRAEEEERYILAVCPTPRYHGGRFGCKSMSFSFSRL